jgi:hypothetical protein
MKFLFLVCLLSIVPILYLNIGNSFFAEGSGDNVPGNLEGLYTQDQDLYIEAGYSYYDNDTGGWIHVETTMYPETANVSIILDVDYIRIKNTYVPVYSFIYTGEFLFANPPNTTIYFPIPMGTITDIMAFINGEVVNRPEVSYNKLKLNLTQENSSLSISFNSSGMQRYSHEVPKNVFVEYFTFYVEINSISDDDIDLKSSLSPNDISASKNSVKLFWENMNSIMRKDIVIDIPVKHVKTENAQAFLMNFIYGLVIIGPITAAFYYEGLKRVKHERNPENCILLSLPYIFLIISLVTLVFWIGISTAIATSMIGFAFISYSIKKRALKVESGFSALYVIPFLPLTMLIGVIMWEVVFGAILIMISSLLLIFFLPHFLMNNPRGEIDKSIIPMEDGETEMKEYEKLPELKESAELKSPKTQIIDKNFCPFCKSNIKSDFGFCPACGKDVASLIKCKKCGVLINTSSEELYCPNCGSKY